MAAVTTLLISLVSSAISMPASSASFMNSWAEITETTPPFGSILGLEALGVAMAIFLSLPLTYGFELMFLKYDRDRTVDMVSESFKGFKTYWRAIGVELLMIIYILLWSLLLFVPGLIKSLAYSMAIYVSHDHPEYSIDQCIHESRMMMRGHKGQLFWMWLGMAGLMILSVIGLFIPLLWIQPWYNSCQVKFYNEVKAEYEQKTAAPVAA